MALFLPFWGASTSTSVVAGVKLTIIYIDDCSDHHGKAC